MNIHGITEWACMILYISVWIGTTLKVYLMNEYVNENVECVHVNECKCMGDGYRCMDLYNARKLS